MEQISPTWLLGVPAPELRVGEVHLWRARLNVAFSNGPDLTMLNPEEKARAARYRNTDTARRFITAHTLLRTLLSSYTPLRPAEIEFLANPQGKPALSPHHALPDFYFNLSHSDD
jgi:4'-phosphopantetheinyl transferase